MKPNNLKEIAAILSQSDQYRVTEKYQRPEFYNIGDSDPKLIGVFLDIEATGLSSAQDKLIELGMVKFEYSENGRIFRLLDEFSRYQDPHMPIPEYISKLTGITDDMVNGHQINENEVASYLQNVDIIIAHNAGFDRVFLEMTFPNIAPKAWGCSMHDIDWKIEGISSHKLEYIAYKYNFFYEGHRAVIDNLAGIHILAQDLPNSKQPVLKQLLTNALQLKFKLWATDSSYDSKDLLRARGYRWSNHPTTNYKSWSIELGEDKVAEEIDYLRSNIYGGSTLNMPVEIVDAYSRFSNNYKHLQNATKYQDKIEWVKMLCLK